MDWFICVFSYSKMNYFEMILNIEIWLVIDCLINIENYDIILVLVVKKFFIYGIVDYLFLLYIDIYWIFFNF